MAMNSSTLGTAIKAGLITAGFFPADTAIQTVIAGDATYTETETNRANRVAKEQAYCNSLAASMVTHITNNAHSSTNVSATVVGICPVGGGPLVGGTGTQTGATGTIS